MRIVADAFLQETIEEVVKALFFPPKHEASQQDKAVHQSNKQGLSAATGQNHS